MARQIDVSDPSKLTRDELLYLQDRDRLPEGVKPLTQDERMKGNELEMVATATGTAMVPKDKVAEATGHTADVDDEDLPEYSDMSVKDLQAEAKDRKLPTNGSKDELVARLEADDAKADGA